MDPIQLEADSVLARLRQLAAGMEENADFVRVLAVLERGGQAALSGVLGSACALVAAALARHTPGTLAVVVPKGVDVDHLRDALELFSDTDCDNLQPIEWNAGHELVLDEAEGERLRTLKRLTGPDPPKILLGEISSFMQTVPSPDAVAVATRTIAVGDRLDCDALARDLLNKRFHNTTAVELPGEFSRRGGIFDIFARDWYEPVRIELFDDEVESLRRFDLATQRSLESLDEIELTALGESVDFRHSEEHVAAFLPEGSRVMLLEPETIDLEGRSHLERLEDLTGYHSVATTFSRLGRFPLVTASTLASGVLDAECQLAIESVERFSGEVGKVREELDKAAADQNVYLVCSTEAEVRRLHELLDGSAVAASGRLHYPIGRLPQGFRLIEQRALLVGSDEIFHRSEPRRVPRRRIGRAIDSFMQLAENDLVVHLAHGIGRYRGLCQLDKDGQFEEHLEIEFAEGTRVYVPASRIELVQKYIGGRGRPVLAKIGGTTWLKRKKAAEESVIDLAVEMLEAQAARMIRPGISFAEETEWQHEFDQSFPYQETNDQLEAVDAVKEDMGKPRPMDRLLCGDVGFGKTEIALRAAFKAIDNGYQVAILVPTTILAEQHYRTFCERMAEFPCEIAKLSRFSTAGGQRKTVERLRSGEVDVVIGTHRLASSDVAFANLGLVVIDEEQRFGVEVKERLKQLRTTVDVLTMTATPIPRTLHMSLIGVRDISNLLTPPEDRFAIETRVARWSDKLIRNAIVRELNRDGQIYFVHNRIQDIHVVEEKLKRIVPEASIRIGHGQMPEHELEEVMVSFVNGEFDLLLATTIVESGLDIPNANTIFVDQANRFGLADLHQLRGRVGRYKHHAYCYLLLEPHQALTPDAARRLHAIEEFSQLGAGFALAMRDLEIRGAGNILGTKQSGHIAAVGYELYCQLLETAVRRLKKLPPRLSVDVEINLPGRAYFPQDYVLDMRTKLDLYRRLRRVTTDEELAHFRDELEDRFGPLPETVEMMLRLASLRIDAAVWQVASLHIEDNYLVFGCSSRPRMEQLAKSSQKELRTVDENFAYLPIPKEVTTPDKIMDLAKSVLRP